MAKRYKPVFVTYLAVALLAAAIGFLAVYVATRGSGNGGGPSATIHPGPKPGAGLPAGPGKNPLSQGDMAAFVFKKEPEALPEISFVDGGGTALNLSGWRGKVVLLNLWATWCAPCRKEMPALDRLQKDLGSDRFEVVALAVDRAGVEGAKRFLDQTKVEALKPYADPSAKMGATLKAVGMPTTLLIDGEGREIGRLVGPAEWDSADAKRLIQAMLR
ncbi:MAG: TlpA family protein disulfide reductase [Hyphomicrobiaceae bacterium]